MGHILSKDNWEQSCDSVASHHAGKRFTVLQATEAGLLRQCNTLAALGLDHIETTSEPQQRALVVEPRPPRRSGHFAAHPSATAALTLNLTCEFNCDNLNDASVKTPQQEEILMIVEPSSPFHICLQENCS